MSEHEKILKLFNELIVNKIIEKEQCGAAYFVVFAEGYRAAKKEEEKENHE